MISIFTKKKLIQCISFGYYYIITQKSLQFYSIIVLIQNTNLISYIFLIYYLIELSIVKIISNASREELNMYAILNTILHN